MIAVGVELKPMQDFMHVISMATTRLAPCHFIILEVDRFYKTKPNQNKTNRKIISSTNSLHKETFKV